MNDISDISNDAIQSQIEKLQAMLDKRQRSAKPEPLSNPDFSPLIELCQSYINDLAEEGYAFEDYEHWMFKTAMSIVFGNGIWDWTKRILRGADYET